MAALAVGPMLLKLMFSELELSISGIEFMENVAEVIFIFQMV